MRNGNRSVQNGCRNGGRSGGIGVVRLGALRGEAGEQLVPAAALVPAAHSSPTADGKAAYPGRHRHRAVTWRRGRLRTAQATANQRSKQ